MGKKLILIIFGVLFFVILSLGVVSSAYCGDGGCTGSENCGNCPEDCGCTSPAICYSGSCCTDTCSSLGYSCDWHWVCGVWKYCGGCSGSTPYCSSGKCVECTSASQCGTDSNWVCSSGSCSCTPDTCNSLGYECGLCNDGCGTLLICPPCGTSKPFCEGRECLECLIDDHCMNYNHCDGDGYYSAESCSSGTCVEGTSYTWCTSIYRNGGDYSYCQVDYRSCSGGACVNDGWINMNDGSVCSQTDYCSGDGYYLGKTCSGGACSSGYDYVACGTIYQTGGDTYYCQANYRSCSGASCVNDASWTSINDGKVCDEGAYCSGDGYFQGKMCNGGACEGTGFIECPDGSCTGADGAYNEIPDSTCASAACSAQTPADCGTGYACDGTANRVDGSACTVAGACSNDNQCADNYVCSSAGNCQLCGNSVTDTGEECDDGANGVDTDLCFDDCTLTYCGDTIEQNPNGVGTGGPSNDGNEACDDGNSVSTDTCTDSCTLTYCGDEIPQSPNGVGTGGPSNDGNEDCDDGANGVNTDACFDDCTFTYCGDDIIQTPNGNGGYEICDDGANNGVDGFCWTNCLRQKTYCGDGTPQSPNDNGVSEECDDGGTSNGDGCSDICEWETEAIWIDANGNQIDTKNVEIGATQIYLLLKYSGLAQGTSVDFEIYENDIWPFPNDDIRVGEQAISGIVDGSYGGRVEISWLVTQEDAEAMKDYFLGLVTDNGPWQVWFEVNGEQSDYLDIIPVTGETCLGISHCVDYDEILCNSDHCGVANSSGEFCDVYSCSCSWDEIEEICKPSYSAVGVCGDGIITAGESCDGDNWGTTITGCNNFDGFDADGGTLLSCDDTCHFNTSLCEGGTEGICNDEVIHTGETCDVGWGLIGGCSDFDEFTGGYLSCDLVSCKFDTSLCTGGVELGSCLITQTIESECDEEPIGLFIYSWEGTWNGLESGAAWQTCLAGGERETVECPAQVQLPFFDFYNVIVTLILIALIYISLIFRKKKK